MKKQKFSLSDSIVKVEEEQVIQENNSKKNIKIEEENSYTLLTVRVKQEFKQEFKAWCAKKNISMSNAVQNAFILLKDKHGY